MMRARSSLVDRGGSGRGRDGVRVVSFDAVVYVRDVFLSFLSLVGCSGGISVNVTIGHAMCNDAKFIDVTIDVVLVTLRPGIYTFRDSSLGVGRDIVSAREPLEALLRSERLFGSRR